VVKKERSFKRVYHHPPHTDTFPRMALHRPAPSSVSHSPDGPSPRSHFVSLPRYLDPYPVPLLIINCSGMQEESSLQEESSFDGLPAQLRSLVFDASVFGMSGTSNAPPRRANKQEVC
jgi:hypothetical protein